MTLSFINVFIGFLLANASYLVMRDKISAASPTKFSFVFWLKDNYIKLIHSLIVSCGINLAFQLNLHEVEALTGMEWLGIYSILIGFSPDVFMSILKNKLKWMQPKNVKVKGKTYNRK